VRGDVVAVRAVEEISDEVVDDLGADDPILVCRTRALGHDWAGGTTRWEDGDTVRVITPGRKRASAVYVCYAVTDCPRCTTVRTEVFQQVDGRWLVKMGNRYRYPPRWKEVAPLTQPELHAMRRRRDRKA
jgi:hypothetical protein